MLCVIWFGRVLKAPQLKHLSMSPHISMIVSCFFFVLFYAGCCCCCFFVTFRLSWASYAYGESPYASHWIENQMKERRNPISIVQSVRKNFFSVEKENSDENNSDAKYNWKKKKQQKNHIFLSYFPKACIKKAQHTQRASTAFLKSFLIRPIFIFQILIDSADQQTEPYRFLHCAWFICVQLSRIHCW